MLPLRDVIPANVPGGMSLAALSPSTGAQPCKNFWRPTY